ncbi:MAG: RNA polymerase sigma factor [Prevotella sp.]
MDIAEFERMYREHYLRLYHIAYDYLLDNELSRDVVGEVFAMAWQKREELEADRVAGYLFISVRNQCYNHLRQRDAQSRYADFVTSCYEEAGVDGLSWVDERVAALSDVIETLPQTTRFVLEQCYFHQHSYREVADMLGISTDGVKKHIMKAFARLRAYFHVKKS